MTRFHSAAALSLLAASPFASAQFLVAADSDLTIATIDPATGARTRLATTSVTTGVPAGLAYDAANRTMYLASSSINSLFRLDLATGAATNIGAYGAGAVLMHGLELDSVNGRLFGASSSSGLYAIDKATGSATLVGMTGLALGSWNLGFDSRSGVMYATHSITDSLYRVNLGTGAATLVGPLNGPISPQGLAYDTDTGTMYLVDNQTDNLYSVDLTTGAATLIGTTGTGNLLGLAYLPRSQGGFTRFKHACGATTIATAGLPRLGHSFQMSLAGVTNTPLLGVGVKIAPVAFCGCTIGHDWSFILLASQLAVPVPTDASLVGLTLGFQGIDYLGTGGCPSPQLTLTDTIVVRIG